MTHKQQTLIREGLSKIAKCYESNYRDYVSNLGMDKYAAEKFDARMSTVDRMKENWENLIRHFINLSHKTYKPIDELDRLNREIELSNWRCIISNELALIANHWAWIGQEPDACKNLICSYCAYDKSQNNN